MDKKESEIKINFKCEFKNIDLEKEYFTSELKRSAKSIKILMLLYSILNFLFIIPDYLYLQEQSAFTDVFLGRLFFLVFFLFFYFFFDKIKKISRVEYLISGLEVLFLIFYLFVLYKYNTTNFLIQTLGLIVIILGLYVLPNKWIYNVIVSIFSVSSFLIYSHIYTKNLTYYDYISGLIYLIIILIFCSVFSFVLNYYKRVNFAKTKQLKELVIIDHMTGIYNKRKFEEELKKCINQAKRYGCSLTIAMFDFDNFKAVNDLYGHVVGDTVIINVISLINKMIRKTDILSKWGGDEFTLLMPFTDINSAIILIERIRKAVESYSVENIKISCSFGVTQFREDDNEITFFCRADKLLYEAKSAGRNSIKYTT